LRLGHERELLKITNRLRVRVCSGARAAPRRGQGFRAPDSGARNGTTLIADAG
jgi:hypothetical protein